ncbi:phage minor capsid protein [Streptosporangium roseum]|uniref:phage minor capsid protein n=1 Tax=Streptosporangium roseum TaxID=2001 RepID=UPI00332F02D8
MALDQDLLDQIAGTVADLYREVEASLIKTVADELKKDLIAPTAEVKLDAVQRLRAAAVAVHQRLQKTRSAVVREAIRQAYRDGYVSALADLPLDKQVRANAREAMKQVPGAAIIENIAAALHREPGRVEGNTEDPEGDIARQKQRALERKIRQEKESTLGALTSEAKKAANQKVRAAQAALRDHLAAHPKLKRLPYRERIGAGNIPPAGGPKGGLVRDLQPPVARLL